MAKQKPQTKEEFQKQLGDISNQIEEQDKAEKDAKKLNEEEIQEKEAKRKDTLLDYIVKKGVVTKEEIDNWKDIYSNKVYATIFDDDEFYIYRHITRPEMKMMIKGMSESTTIDQEEEALVRKAVLYPEMTTDVLTYIGSGTIRTLAYQIRIASNDIPDSLAIEMIQKI